MRKIIKDFNSFNSPKFSDLVGKVLTKIVVNNDSIHFTTSDDENFSLYHEQDCCENVYVESVVGDIDDLIGSPITMAIESSSDNPPFKWNKDKRHDSPLSDDDDYEWTFYKLATIKGYVDIRWYGSSNGYYSTSVSFGKT